MPRLPEKLWLLVALAAVHAGCKPKIGDDCRISTDCSAAGDRLCDITAPGGYCTVFGCEPGTCPEDEALCVEFGQRRSPLCHDNQSPSPYARTFCMAKCDSNSDCRGGYQCVDIDKDGLAWGALRIDKDRGTKACLVPLPPDQASSEDMSMGDEPGVCRAEYYTGGTGGVGGTAGAGAAGGSSPGAGGDSGGASAAAGAAGDGG
jgi:hypothetical protein